MFLFPVNVLSWWCFCFQLMFYHGDVSVSSFCLSWWCFCFQLMFYHNDVSVSSQCLSWWCFLKRSLLIDLSLQPNFSHLILSPLSLLPTHFFQQIFSSSFTLFGKSSDPPHIHVATNYRQKREISFCSNAIKVESKPILVSVTQKLQEPPNYCCVIKIKLCNRQMFPTYLSFLLQLSILRPEKFYTNFRIQTGQFYTWIFYADNACRVCDKNHIWPSPFITILHSFLVQELN